PKINPEVNKYEALWWNEDIIMPAKRGQISLGLKKLLDVMASSYGSRRNVIKHKQL
ncbi:MAG: hypothetical protein EZS28_050698, partial [Streblomastix strix]